MGEPPPDDEDLNLKQLRDPDGSRSPSWTRAVKEDDEEKEEEEEDDEDEERVKKEKKEWSRITKMYGTLFK